MMLSALKYIMIIPVRDGELRLALAMQKLTGILSLVQIDCHVFGIFCVFKNREFL